jgi:hypothetical protein
MLRRRGLYAMVVVGSQHRGSVHGVVPGRPGFLKPVGHWNVGFLGHDDELELRNVRVKELSKP